MRRALIAATVVVVSVGLAQGGIRADLSGDAVIDFQTTMDMPFVTVGNPGNAADPETGYGGVDYIYNIGKFEVTTGQYTEFLNAVAETDTYGLYNTDMGDPSPGIRGCNIQRSGSSGSYAYAVAADWEDRPVNCLGWGDAARFANWLTNGMPTGAQDLTTTEDGSYLLDGAMSDAALVAVTRKNPEDGGRYYIPSEDEWYKAAYHKNDGDTGNYYDYPTSSDAVPSNSLIDPDPGNNANFTDIGYTISMPYYRTEVGEFENSDSPYYTFDMGGNVWEWNEAIPSWLRRGLRGGVFGSSYSYLQATLRSYHYPTTEDGFFGFRVSQVPEPGSTMLVFFGGVGLLGRRRKGREQRPRKGLVSTGEPIGTVEPS